MKSSFYQRALHLLFMLVSLSLLILLVEIFCYVGIIIYKIYEEDGVWALAAIIAGSIFIYFLGRRNNKRKTNFWNELKKEVMELKEDFSLENLKEQNHDDVLDFMEQCTRSYNELSDKKIKVKFISALRLSLLVLLIPVAIALPWVLLLFYFK